jgi:signal transduction histidine kinase
MRRRTGREEESMELWMARGAGGREAAAGRQPRLEAAGPSADLGAPDSFEAVAGLRGWRLWLSLVAFWAILGFIIGNHVYYSMRTHGHSWSRVVLWQMGGAAAWIVLTPVVIALDRRFPLRRHHIARAFAVHVVAALSFAAVRLVPLTAFSRRLDPFRPVPREGTFVAEYLALIAEWVHLDILVYVAILAVAHAAEYRQQIFRDRLRASRLQAELAAAELRALELEIQPHFLFNALNGINGLVGSGENRLASRLLVGLGDLLRATLKRRGRQLVSLKEELEHVALYLDLQKARFGERLRVEVRVAPELLRAAVPGLVLQPLVENAIRHGVERRSGPCTVTIGAEREDSTLRLLVADDGPGPGEQRGRGIGLDNIRSRLKALYGQGWRLDLEGAGSSGTRASLAIPWRLAEAEAS